MNHNARFLALTFALLLSALATAPAFADLYRCLGRDGSVVFTDDASTCPGASKHESTGALQTLRSDAPAPPSAAPARLRGRASTADADAPSAMKRHWQAKKRAKEEELRVLEERSEYLSRYVTGCNRGSEIIARDESGIKRTVPCDEIRARYEQALARQKPLREYLEHGLKRECREAGCLPGWIR